MTKGGIVKVDVERKSSFCLRMCVRHVCVARGKRVERKFIANGKIFVCFYTHTHTRTCCYIHILDNTIFSRINDSSSAYFSIFLFFFLF